MSDFLSPAFCANTNRQIGEEITPCQNEAKNFCHRCGLVQYCSRECQTSDWVLHRTDCRSKYLDNPYVPRWEVEDRLPEFMQGPPLSPFGTAQYLWGNIPAIDLLKVNDNEGEETIVHKDIALLFAASGDLRNVVKTIAGLPENYAGKCSVVMNDHNLTIVARNTIMLLTALHLEPEAAAPILLHLWYSAFLPPTILRTLQDKILPEIHDVCDKIKNKSSNIFLDHEFRISRSRLSLMLKKPEWDALANMFKVPTGLTLLEAESHRHSVTLARPDYIDRSLLHMSPGRRLGAVRFRQDGVLLPFGASRRGFTLPNPTLFSNTKAWPMQDNADPLNGWTQDEYMKFHLSAKNDVYGAFYFHMRNILLSFCKRLRACEISFRLLGVNAVQLPTLDFLKVITFDRIEVSNICDNAYVGPQATLATFGPMLKQKSENPSATLLLLFFNAVREEQRKYPDPHDIITGIVKIQEYLDLQPYFVTLTLANFLAGWIDLELISVEYALNLFGNFDEYFRRFLDSPDLSRRASMYDLARENGLKIKKKHTIIEPWPYRVKESTTKEEFKAMLSENTCGHERYMELERP